MNLIQNKKERVFISHASDDKEFVQKLAKTLGKFGISVWYDKWEIAIGDSIVEKIFKGLESSDILVIVLSPTSVVSRWVNEELSVAVMKKISENNIRILPVLIKSCNIPLALKHIKYADFRKNHNEALFDLVDSIAPGHFIWQSLSHYYDHFCLLCDKISQIEISYDSDETIQKIFSLLESALNLRTEIELRINRKEITDLNFFEKIMILLDRGIDVRSQAWNDLVHIRSHITHYLGKDYLILYRFAKKLDERYNSDNLQESLTKGLNRLKQIMSIICFAKVSNNDDQQ